MRERLEALLDDGSFVEIDVLARHRATGFGLEHSRPDTDGVVTGWGTVNDHGGASANVCPVVVLASPQL